MIASQQRSQLLDAGRDLQSWLANYAFDLWWTRGADHLEGGFHESLRLDATPTGAPRRARLHPRQMFAYSRAAALGWPGPVDMAVRHGLDFFLTHYRRPDGLFRTLVTARGEPCDNTAVLYDQAFALLGLASAHSVLRDERLRTTARELHDQLRLQLACSQGGFEESTERTLPLSSNSHMHLLEASLEWMALDPDSRWGMLVEQLIELAVRHWIGPHGGAMQEFFDRQRRPVPAAVGPSIDPGHQFEWAWLLLRWHARGSNPGLRRAALRLMEIGEARGVDPARDVVLAGLADEGAIPSGSARLWPQCERIKAACLAAQMTGDQRHWQPALEAAHALQRYLDTPIAGMWRDRMNVDGTFVEEPSPASSFYHIVSVASELVRAAALGPGAP
jgi:mannose-6-phosphate isomerase